MRITFESYEDNFNEFVMHLPITLLVEPNKYLYTVEDWKVDPDLLILPNKSTGADISSALGTVHQFLDNVAKPNLVQIINYYNHISPYNYTCLNTNMGGKGKSGHNFLDVSYYMIIGCNVSNINCSNKISQQLSEFKIRVANHISKSEQKTLDSFNNVKIYHEQVVGLYQKLFEQYTSNIFKAYTNFLDTLSTYSQYIESFEDINREDIDIVKSVSVQGEF